MISDVRLWSFVYKKIQHGHIFCGVRKIIPRFIISKEKNHNFSVITCDKSGYILLLIYTSIFSVHIRETLINLDF